MTRIVAGAARGRGLTVPPRGTRPTSDRAREALFSAVESLLGGRGGWLGLRSLDLFAGSGAVGLETLSRGGETAVLVESSPAAVTVIKANLAAVGLPGASIVAARVAAFLARQSEPFGFVFLDPPYATADAEVDATLVALRDRGWLAPEAVVVVERATRGPSLAWPDGYDVRPERASRTYGDATMWFATAPPPAV